LSMGPSDSDDEPCVIAGHFTLTDEQRRFNAMLSEYPQLMPYWDFEQRTCDIEVLRSALDAMSSGEQHMARFFAAVQEYILNRAPLRMYNQSQQRCVVWA